MVAGVAASPAPLAGLLAAVFGLARERGFLAVLVFVAAALLVEAGLLLALSALAAGLAVLLALAAVLAVVEGFLAAGLRRLAAGLASVLALLADFALDCDLAFACALGLSSSSTSLTTLFKMRLPATTAAAKATFLKISLKIPIQTPIGN